MTMKMLEYNLKCTACEQQMSFLSPFEIPDTDRVKGMECMSCSNKFWTVTNREPTKIHKTEKQLLEEILETLKEMKQQEYNYWETWKQAKKQEDKD